MLNKRRSSHRVLFLVVSLLLRNAFSSDWDKPIKPKKLHDKAAKIKCTFARAKKEKATDWKSFVSNYQRPPRPVVLSDLMEDWPAAKLDKEGLDKKFGSIKVRVRLGHLVHLDRGEEGEWEQAIPISEYASLVSTTDVLYENEYSEITQALLKSTSSPEAFKTAVHEKPLFEMGQPGSGVGFRKRQQLWLGQLSGRKVWFVAPKSAQMPSVKNPCHYLLQGLPAGVEGCVVQPLEIVFIPKDWWHASCNIDSSNMGTGWIGSTSKWPAVRHAIASGAEITPTDEALLKDREDSGDSLLAFAARTGHVPWVQALIYLRAELNGKDATNRSALHWAAKNGHLETAKVLLESGASTLVFGTDGESPLISACIAGQLDLIDYFLDQGLDISKGDAQGRTPAHIATLGGHVDALRLLLRRGADGSATSDDGSQPLHIATMRGKLEVAQALIEKDVSIDAPNRHGMQPIHFAAAFGHIELLKFLHTGTGQEASLTSKDFAGNELVHYAAMYGYVDVLTYLLKKNKRGARATGEYARTPLHFAAKNGHMAAVRLLVEMGADLFAKEKGSVKGKGLTAEGVAKAANHVDIAVFLKQEKVQKKRDQGGKETKLHTAAANGELEKIQQLLAEGEDLMAKDVQGANPLMMATQYGHLGAVELLVENKADVKAKMNDGSTSMHIAGAHGKNAIIEYLAKKFGKQMQDFISLKDHRGTQPLHQAITMNQVTMVNLLLKLRADVKAADISGSQPLFHAAMHGRTEIAKHLLKARAHPRHQNAKQQDVTALHHAANEGSMDMIKLLVNARADPKAKDTPGFNPAHAAQKAGHTKVMKYLGKLGAELVVEKASSKNEEL